MKQESELKSPTEFSQSYGFNKKYVKFEEQVEINLEKVDEIEKRSLEAKKNSNNLNTRSKFFSAIVEQDED